jgi:hypothetical protein
MAHNLLPIMDSIMDSPSLKKLTGSLLNLFVTGKYTPGGKQLLTISFKTSLVS